MAHAELLPPAGQAAGRLSYEEFLAWCDEDTWAEWVDGEVVLLSPASLSHQRVMVFLATVLNIFARALHLGQVLSAPFQMKLGPDGPGREPDLLFVAREHLGRLLPTRLEGPADLVVEIVSPESRERDRGQKYGEYEAAGIGEYWLIDPERQEAAFHRLGPDGRYHLLPVDAAGVVRSEVLPGFWLRIAWLWQDPLPDAGTGGAAGGPRGPAVAAYSGSRG